MKKHLFPIVLLLLGNTISAQQDFFALTGKNSPGIEFSDFRAMNSDGTSGESIFGVSSEAKVISQARKSAITEVKNSYSNSQATTLATLAFDASGNNLVYMPMFSSNIYVLNQKTKEITLVENTVARVSSCDINSHITRMATGYDGNIYAINNAGTQFLQISKKHDQYTVSDLGIIKDDASNGKNSFTAMETGFGGDIIADADNNFYVFSASGNVFKVSTKELKAKFVGKITGLPENYSVNGAAVNSKGNIVVASAKGAALYELNLNSLEAKQLPGEQSLHIYDLASKYFANDRVAANNTFANIDIYPTKVEDQTITVNVNDKSVKGNIKVNIFDISGKSVMSSNLSVKDGNLNQQIQLRNLVTGAYLVNITEESGKTLLSKKILVTK
ncbi:secretion protein [Chryseobacterium formosense]|uniref:Secretion protein n=1 Tax=Chryseobacterium formosense TaxID=236814 RepID=A0A085Z303_9FLAO|nr:T9SS type A sorting domain-containing protein [Chryseobacterium formosense]KFE98816.1 secretion protein [Chryseobacterium formosense]SFT57768.1 Por secretion system C-terminal sorting domain-containing protein [Chryseobacterium formosense]